ncbi:MAG TPA: hypothetical protein VGR62_06805 [Candidatus Binatia bacterium]|jgi:hypothetical protein|nr:hypothetical protein [Candidatus Binatia bacterium]
MSMRRRTVLKAMVVGGTMAGAIGRVTTAGGAPVDTGTSRYGRWVRRHGLPAFSYEADQEALPEAEWDPVLAPRTRRHWTMLGNRAIQLQAANDGTVALFDESAGLRWLVAADPVGTGVSVLDDGIVWGSAFAQRAGETPSRRTFGPTWFEVRDVRDGLELERTILCPEGESPWVLVRVRLALAGNARGSRTLRHVERWQLAPRFLNLFEPVAQRRTRAAQIAYDVQTTARGLLAVERFPAAADFTSGAPARLVLERLGRTEGSARQDGAVPHPALEIETSLVLRPGERRELWFRFGREDATPVDDPRRVFDRSLRALASRLPQGTSPDAPIAEREIPWHAALLTGGLSLDRVVGGHTLDQASTYSFVMGFNGAARDPLQHALPLVYTEPAMALSVLRNTCAWASVDGNLPYALDGAKRPTNIIFRPSDQNLWALWLAAEYAAATGDLAAFDAPLPYHPSRGAAAVPLREHLRRQHRFFTDGVGRGERGHVRILNADWNDLAIGDSGVEPAVMIERGGSVLNSAMASWVLGVFAGLAERLGETALVTEARAQSEELRQLVAAAWNGRWFHRAYAPGVAPVGDDDCWLEVQPWALLCGAADATQARALLDVIDAGHRAGSPLGARVRWPAPPDAVAAGAWGDATSGGIWYSINMTLVWAASRIDRALAWDEWRRMTLQSHTEAYPDIWEGTLSGPDAWNATESTRPGRTWATTAFAMQAFPVSNLHSHAQPLLAYLRLLGVEPTTRGTLAVGSGGRFRSPVFRLEREGHGRLRAQGPVMLETARGTVTGDAGIVRW